MSDIQNTSPAETQEKPQTKNQFIKILHNNIVQLILKIISILTGIFFIFGGLGALSTSVFAGFLFLICGALCFPIIHKLINKYSNKELSGFIYMPICFVLLMIGGGNMPKTQSAVGIVTSSNSSQIISTSSIDSSMQKVSQEAEKLAKIEADKKVEEERKKDDEAKISAEKKAEEEKKKADESSKSDFTILEDLAKVNKAELWILKNDDSFSNANEGEGNYRIILNLPNFVENCDDAKKTAYYILEKFYTDSKVGNKIFTIRINILRNLNIEMGGKLAQSLTNSKLWSGPTNFWKNIDQTSLVKTLDQKLLSSDSIRASYNQINCKQKDSN